MWNGRSNVDQFAIGIENEGYHDQPLTPRQERALAALLAQLKQRYQIPDSHILTHSMVAYGAPNRWVHHAHRGRKRCGMLMADPAVRRRLGLAPAPTHDPDVESGRLIVGDPYLFRALFEKPQDARSITQTVYSGPESNMITPERSAWFIAREKYDEATTLYTLPGGRVVHGDQVRDWGALPTGTKVSYSDSDRDVPVRIKEIGRDGRTAYDIAAMDYAKTTTIYFLPDGKVRTGDQMQKDYADILRHLPEHTGILVGYVYGGYVTTERSALSIAGDKWNSPSTYYRINPANAAPRLVSGDDIDSSRIPPNTLIFFED